MHFTLQNIVLSNYVPPGIPSADSNAATQASNPLQRATVPLAITTQRESSDKNSPHGIMAYMQAYKTPQQWLDALQASQRPSGSISDRLIAWGVASSEKQARQVLIGVIVIAIAVALLIMRSMFGPPNTAMDQESAAQLAKMLEITPSMQGEPPR